jgi:hypothetical protein
MSRLFCYIKSCRTCFGTPYAGILTPTSLRSSALSSPAAERGQKRICHAERGGFVHFQIIFMIFKGDTFVTNRNTQVYQFRTYAPCLIPITLEKQ